MSAIFALVQIVCLFCAAIWLILGAIYAFMSGADVTEANIWWNNPMGMVRLIWAKIRSLFGIQP